MKAESFQPIRMLLVEDDPTGRLYVKEYLENIGHTVIEATNGREALDRLREQHFDLIFMDIMMPVMDGIETTQRIRCGDAGEEVRKIPIVALTAYDLRQAPEALHSLDMFEYLIKPVAEELLDQVTAKIAELRIRQELRIA